MGVNRRAESIRRLYADAPTLAPPNLVTTMQDLWYLFLIAAFGALTFGIAAACAALGARK